MDNAKRALLKALSEFEAQFKEVKQEYKDNLHLNAELNEKSIPAKYGETIQKLMNDQAIVLTSRLAVALKGQIKLVLLHFANNNHDVNGYAIDVVEMLTCGIVANPEDNLTNQLMDIVEVGQLPKEMANLEVKVEEMDQDSTEVVLSPVVSSDDPQLKPSTSAHSNHEEMINKLPRSVTTPVLEQKANNRPVVIEQSANILKRDMWKKLPLNPPTCLVKDCGTKFDYRRIRQDYIEKDHQNTRVWHCALCHKHYTTYTTLDGHYQMKHVNSYQCTFPSCTFTCKTKRQVIKHFEECHLVSAIVNNHEDKSTNQDDLSEHGASSDAPPINQGSVASDALNELPVVQQLSAESKILKRTLLSLSNEQHYRIHGDRQGQSSASVKKAKLDSTHSNNAQSNVSDFQSTSDHSPTKEGLQLLNTNGKVVSLGLKCFQLDCEQLFDTQKELNLHMWMRHCIRAFPCLLKDCGKSFDDIRSRNDHIKKDHKKALCLM